LIEGERKTELKSHRRAVVPVNSNARLTGNRKAFQKLETVHFRCLRANFMGRRVLVVDDDVLVLELLASMLEELGCETLKARSGTEALGTIAKDHAVEILISDINMPGLSGSELAERAHSYRPKLRVILLTGGPSDSRDFPLLHKPFAQSDLQRLIAGA
jgi:two-component system cell cycle response regulator CpdR